MASLIFYCGWDLRYLPLLLGSVLFNFIVGRAISKCLSKPKVAKLLLIAGISINLVILGYYKYADFFIENINEVFDSQFLALHIILPLGISFFTFTQTAFLVDAYKGKSDEPDFVQYLAFVTYFPHLIAGPILHHHETIPQFKRGTQLQACWIAPGLAMFAIGLFKKVVIADTFGAIARPIFAAYASGDQSLTGMDAWVGALSYTFQLYFDFSAYCDMAVGVSLMFGIYIPLNFNSPYKSRSIIEFWRRWHMTLSRYLRDYLYIALGGNRRGNYRRYINLMLTMLIGGLWHGAGWTFIIWGGLHGLYLMINHFWRTLFKSNSESLIGQWAGRILTFLCVVVAWVFFRSDSVASALSMLSAMASVPETLSPLVAKSVASIMVPQAAIDAGVSVSASYVAVATLIAGFVIVWGFRNAQELVFRKSPWDSALEDAPAPLEWTSRRILLPLSSAALLVGLAALIAAPPGEFLYFNF
ncbi:MBOAT family O-acyltransferase [Pseudomonas fluorescens]|uniref:MBOAT family O-acyltransferase n=1 Tax=Pseudomonas fluorescens TaxID=294 RepID=UPI001CD79AB9|nr:MBOAT family protein [Pseudomonas fluorescens]